MFETSAMLLLDKNVKALTVDLNHERRSRLPKNHGKLTERNVDRLTPLAFLLIVYDQLAPLLMLPRIEVK